MTAVNRAVALAEVRGAEAGLAALAAIPDPDRLSRWLPWQAARAGLLIMAGHDAEACDALAAALELQPPAAERRFLERRLRRLTG